MDTFSDLTADRKSWQPACVFHPFSGYLVNGSETYTSVTGGETDWSMDKQADRQICRQKGRRTSPKIGIYRQTGRKIDSQLNVKHEQLTLHTHETLCFRNVCYCELFPFICIATGNSRVERNNNIRIMATVLVDISSSTASLEFCLLPVLEKE